MQLNVSSHQYVFMARCLIRKGYVFMAWDLIQEQLSIFVARFMD